MIGLSLSFCVLDIAAGKAKESDVERIIAGTCAKSDGEMLEVIASYQHSYWSEYPLAWQIATRLLDRIEQPRLKGKEPPFIGDGHWIKDGIKVWL
jgi:hypothetical protein